MTGGPLRVLVEGLVFGESPRWRDGRLWVSDWGAGEVLAVDPSGGREVVVRLASFPMCIDPLPDGRLLVVDSGGGRLLRREPDGALVTVADLAPAGAPPWNEVVADRAGRAYVNAIGFDFPDEPAAPGWVARVDPDGSVRRVADELEFPNGMALTADGSTLLVAESSAHRITAFTVGPDGGLADRRVWADLGEGTPDGVCLDADGALWYADVPARRCVRVREGGAVLQVVEADRGCFSCALGGPDGRTLFVVAQEWGGDGGGAPTGQVLTTGVEVPAAAPS